MAKSKETEAAGETGETAVPPDPQGPPPPKVRTAEEEAAKAARAEERRKAKEEAVKAGSLPAPAKTDEPARIPPHKSLAAAVEAIIRDIRKRPCTEGLQLVVRKLTAASAALEADAETKPAEVKPLRW